MKLIFAKKLNQCIDEYPASKTEVLKLLSSHLKCSTDAIQRWRRADAQISNKYLDGVAKFFGKPLEFFISADDKEASMDNDELRMCKELIKYLKEDLKRKNEKIAELEGKIKLKKA